MGLVMTSSDFTEDNIPLCRYPTKPAFKLISGRQPWSGEASKGGFIPLLTNAVTKGIIFSWSLSLAYLHFLINKTIFDFHLDNVF